MKTPSLRVRRPGRTVDAVPTSTGAATPDAAIGAADVSPAQTEKWTNGGRLRTNAITAAIFLALLVLPTAAALVLGARPAQVRATGSPGSTSSADVRAGEFAQAFVKAWLAPAGADALDPYYPGAAMVPSDHPPKVDQLTTADIRAGEDGIVTVTVGADLDGVRRYFAVPLQVDDSGISALSLPAPAAAPARADPPQLAYSEDLLTSGPACQAITAFLGAMLTGQGDISRYTSPGRTIAAIKPAPYVRAELQAARSVGEEPPPANDGTRLQVLASAVLTDPAKRQFLATYALELTARGGRWEVSRLQLAPEIQTDRPTSPGTATPAPQTTSQGEAK